MKNNLLNTNEYLNTTKNRWIWYIVDILIVGHEHVIRY